jgi:hypothetical protein
MILRLVLTSVVDVLEPNPRIIGRATVAAILHVESVRHQIGEEIP